MHNLSRLVLSFFGSIVMGIFILVGVLYGWASTGFKAGYELINDLMDEVARKNVKGKAKKER